MMGWDANDAQTAFWSTPIQDAARRLASLMRQHAPAKVYATAVPLSIMRAFAEHTFRALAALGVETFVRVRDPTGQGTERETDRFAGLW